MTLTSVLGHVDGPVLGSWGPGTVLGPVLGRVPGLLAGPSGDLGEVHAVFGLLGDAQRLPQRDRGGRLGRSRSC